MADSKREELVTAVCAAIAGKNMLSAQEKRSFDDLLVRDANAAVDATLEVISEALDAKAMEGEHGALMSFIYAKDFINREFGKE